MQIDGFYDYRYRSSAMLTSEYPLPQHLGKIMGAEARTYAKAVSSLDRVITLQVVVTRVTSACIFECLLSVQMHSTKEQIAIVRSTPKMHVDCMVYPVSKAM